MMNVLLTKKHYIKIILILNKNNMKRITQKDVIKSIN
jgi:hypothetical protein